MKIKILFNCLPCHNQHAARRLRELFRGRFNQDVAIQLIDDLGGELQAVDFILNEKEKVVQEYLKKKPEFIDSMREDSKQLANLLENGIEYEMRQFACAGCVRSWWKKVPIRKEVSKCFRCKTKYDPVPKEFEWGWAKFICTCKNEFHGYGENGVTKSPCYDCNCEVPVHSILPPKKRIGQRLRKSKNPHCCNGVNCFSHGGDGFLSHGGDGGPNAVQNNYMGGIGSRNVSYGATYNFQPVSVGQGVNTGSTAKGSNTTSKGKYNSSNKKPGDSSAPGAYYGQKSDAQSDAQPICFHPKSVQPLRRKIRTPSQRHYSTGSTVSTFLSQGSLDTQSVSLSFTLGSISELD